MIKNGMLFINGTFDKRIIDPISRKLPEFAVAIRLRFGKSDGGKHNIVVSLQNEKGEKVMSDFQKEITYNPDPAKPIAALPIVYKVESIQDPQEGAFTFNLLVDGVTTALLPYYVLRVTHTVGTR